MVRWKLVIEIEESLYNKAKEMKIDLKTFIVEFEKLLKNKMSEETAGRYLNRLKNLKDTTVESPTNPYRS
ncbi:hypothetical protein [Archaeoglobus sp.]